MPILAFVLGIAVGGAALWSQDQPEEAPPPHRLDEHAVELVLFEVVPPTPPERGEPEAGSLQIKGALLLSGRVTSTVVGIGTLNRGLDVRAPALPVTVAPTDRFQPVNLRIIVEDCEAAGLWTPDDRPFTVTWRDEYGKEHLDRAGDFGRSVARLLVRHIRSMCGTGQEG